MVRTLTTTRLSDLLTSITNTPATSTVQLMSYPGFAALMADLEITTPEQMLNEQSATMMTNFTDAITPHSPMTPEEGGTRAAALVASTNIAYGVLIALATAMEIGTLGQVETPALMLPHAPVIRASIEASVAATMAYFNASVVKAYEYLALKDHTPMIIPENALIDAQVMGIISNELYMAQMLYHGYSPERSSIMAASGIRMPNIGEILELLRRGILSDTGAIDWLVKSKIPRPTAEGLINLKVQKPEPYRAADFYAKGLIEDADLKEIFHWVGIEDKFADAWAKSQLRFPDFNTSLELLWRGAISLDTLKTWLKRSATPDEATTALVALTEQIPPSNDLVTMVVREAWEPANVTPAPDIFATYMAKRGFNKDWSDRYWTAHWLPMDIQYGYANLHRGFWTKEMFDDLLRIADIHPRWRDAIYNVAFNPPSIREMGYGYDVGAYTKEDVIKYRRWGGLSEVDANKAGLAMVAYRTEAEREAVRREYLNLYQLGKLSDDEFTGELIAIGTATEAVPLWLERGQLRRSALAYESSILEPKAMTRSDAQWLFEHGVYEETWLRSSLLNLGYEAEIVESYILQSKQRIAEKATPLEPRKLTLAQLRTLYSLQQINQDEYKARLITIGYTSDDALKIINITDASLAVEPKVIKFNEITTSQLSDLYYYGFIGRSQFVERMISNGYETNDANLLVDLYLLEQSISDLKGLYSKGWINAADMFSEFINLGLSDEVATTVQMLIVKAEQPARVATEKDLTKAEIVKGAKNNVITVSSAVSLLEDLGYDENEAWYILAINKVVSVGDPEGYYDMRRVTEAYKKARGDKYVDIPQELIDLERQQKQIKTELDTAKKIPDNDIKIGEIGVQLANVNSRIITITSKLGIS
jgi:hypothetical protein